MELKFMSVISVWAPETVQFPRLGWNGDLEGEGSLFVEADQSTTDMSTNGFINQIKSKLE